MCRTTRLAVTLLFASTFALCWPAVASTGADSAPSDVSRVQAGLTAQALATPSVPQGVPELSEGDVVGLLVRAVAGREWGLLVSSLLVLLVLVARKIGARWLPWLGTERGVATLALVGGTATLLALALSQGQAFSLGLLVSCLLGALSASGLWSVSKSLVAPRPAAGPICAPDEIANGTCRV